MRENLPDKSYFISKPVPGYEGHTITKYVDSGCNAHVFLAENTSIQSRVACKVIPVTNISRDDSAWLEEAKNANLLRTPSVVRCLHTAWWKDEAAGIDCAVLCFEFISGKSLRKVLSTSAFNVNMDFVMRFLEAALQLVYELDTRSLRHGDLHAGNVLVEEQSDFQLQQSVSFRFTDFGVGMATSQEDTYLDDFAAVGSILRDLLLKIDYQQLDAQDRFLFNKINQDFLGRHLYETDPTIDPCARNARQMFEKLRGLESAYQESVLRLETASLQTPFDYLNCEQIGEEHQLLEALYSDKFLGLPEVEQRQNLVLTGPRGCGKTTVFRSLSLNHRIHTKRAQPEDVHYIAVYYRCDDLNYAFPRFQKIDREEAVDLPMQYLTASLLALLIDTIESWATIHFKDALKDESRGVLEELWNLLDFNPGGSPEDYTMRATTRKLRAQSRKAAERKKFIHDTKRSLGDLYGPEILPRACQCLSKFSFLRKRPFYFFVDDYSSPKVTDSLQRNLNRLLMQRFPDCFFKISTESPVSFVPGDIDGKNYVEGREFALVNLALLFLTEDKEGKRAFIEDVFRKRLTAVEDFPVKELATLIGTGDGISYNEQARMLRAKKKIEYWGLDCLTDLCSGDIHYLINLVDRMVREAGGHSRLATEEPAVPVSIQSKAIRDEAGQFLNNLRGVYQYGERAVAVVTAFGNIAYSYLLHRDAKNENTRPPHQASRIEPLDQLDLQPDEAELYRQLLRYSIFIEEPKGKSRKGKVVPRLWLRRFLIPHFRLSFSKRDSIELSNEQILQLLREPNTFEERMRAKKRASSDPHQGELFDR